MTSPCAQSSAPQDRKVLTGMNRSRSQTAKTGCEAQRSGGSDYGGAALGWSGGVRRAGWKVGNMNDLSMKKLAIITSVHASRASSPQVYSRSCNCAVLCQGHRTLAHRKLRRTMLVQDFFPYARRPYSKPEKIQLGACADLFHPLCKFVYAVTGNGFIGTNRANVWPRTHSRREVCL